MLSSDDVLSKAPNCTCAKMGSQTALLREKDPKPFMLSETGSLAWERLDGHSSIGDIARNIARQYDAEYAAVQKDTIAFFERMIEFGLVGYACESERS